MENPVFDLSNTNKVYSLLGTFIKNPYGFHAANGEGYKLIADAIIKLDQINPPLAANLANSLVNWDKYDNKRQKMMIQCLEMIDSQVTSTDVRNTLKKGLDKARTDSPPIPIRLTFHGGASTAESTQEVLIRNEGISISKI